MNNQPTTTPPSQRHKSGKSRRPSVARMAAAILVATPVALTPWSAAQNAHAATKDPTVKKSVASVLAARKKPTPRTGAQKPLPALTKAQYLAQKPAWSSKTCSTAARVAADTGNSPYPIECARISTPLDWQDFSKGSINLNITRLKHSGKARSARPLFVNPGGPGSPAGEFVSAIADSKESLRTTHDIIGVDPRGTGLSSPVECPLPDFTPKDQRDTSKAVRERMWQSYKQWTQSCTSKHPKVLPHITTANTVADMDLVRQVLGFKTIDFFGTSGGSWMGAWMAKLYPHSTGRVLTDANAKFTGDWRSSFALMPQGFQRRWDKQALPWIARHNKDFGLGTTASEVRNNYEKIRSEVAKGRVRDLTPASFDATLMQMLYSDESLSSIGATLKQLNVSLRGSKGTVKMPSGQTFEPEDNESLLSTQTVRTAIVCNDTNFDRRRESLEKEYLNAQKKYPLQGSMLSVIAAPCAYWPWAPKKVPTINGSGSANILMIQGEVDPATPVEGARAAHAAHSATRMITIDNDGNHGAFTSAPDNKCVNNIALAWLQRGIWPRQDVTCKGAPLPMENKIFEVATP
ncbi:Tripeptidyl aminopeptidase precursor [Dermatophilus congolensis]|uniref:Tripeptidyl aminopeptidase n=1 Tax=Dermatophilus congolensis TaxID=1863 RepID=A0AA46GZM0_9MICO|nr:alpha/beta hydrolase [Dermatophilus congolensis]STD04648.1 Tripeptidyl aminopeptidase precursor [Dermatophilus congolensis]